MSPPIVLASGSEIRRHLLAQAGVTFEVDPVRVDEDVVKQSLLADGATPREVADALAEAKARRGSARHPGAMVIGCDQVLDFKETLFSKPVDEADLTRQLADLNGAQHNLISAAVIYQDNEPLWRHVGVVKMHMRNTSASYRKDYVARNWASIRHCVGGYKLEEEGARLFQRIDGDYFCVLGLPLLEILGYLTLREVLAG